MTPWLTRLLASATRSLRALAALGTLALVAAGGSAGGWDVARSLLQLASTGGDWPR